VFTVGFLGLADRQPKLKEEEMAISASAKSAVSDDTIRKWIESVQSLVGNRGKVAKEKDCECLVKLDISFSTKRPPPLKLFQQIYGAQFEPSWAVELTANATADEEGMVHIVSRCECFTVIKQDARWNFMVSPWDRICRVVTY
jgi:hypothetical protein